MSTSLEWLHQQALAMAAEHNIPIATAPLLTVESVQPRARLVRVPLDDIVAFGAEENGENPDSLAAMHLRLVDMQDDAAGRVIGRPMIVDGAVRYPVVDLVIAEDIYARSLNTTLRHELRHIFQGGRYSMEHRRPYERPAAVRATQVMGVISMACVAVPAAYEATHNSSPLMMAFGYAGLALGVVGVIASASSERLAQAMLHTVDGSELDAEWFAFRTRRFRPITIAGE